MKNFTKADKRLNDSIYPGARVPGCYPRSQRVPLYLITIIPEDADAVGANRWEVVGESVTHDYRTVKNMYDSEDVRGGGYVACALVCLDELTHSPVDGNPYVGMAVIDCWAGPLYKSAAEYVTTAPGNWPLYTAVKEWMTKHHAARLAEVRNEDRPADVPSDEDVKEMMASPEAAELSRMVAEGGPDPTP